SMRNMKLTPWYLAALAPLAVAGCSGAFLGHFAVLALTLGIFFGTLSLGRHTRDAAIAPAGPIEPRANVTETV
ncbi:MAG TPA: hypothetical protein VLM85_02090, partial [Polyangiaceae bacterium]|nr:hypothetical protein [Polyangiaceae bacterium]